MTLPPRALHVTLTKGAGFDPPPAAEKPDWQEYYFTQQLVTGFNSDCLEVKKWSVTAASGIAVLGTAAEVHLPAVFAIVATSALAFWITETVWRMNQWAFVRSIRRLEEDNANHPGYPQVSTRWAGFWGQAAGSGDGSEGTLAAGLRHFIGARTMLPHAFVFGASALGLVLSGLGLVDLTGRNEPPKPTEVHAVVSGSLEVSPPAGSRASAPKNGA